jgi:hypothetical protein
MQLWGKAAMQPLPCAYTLIIEPGPELGSAAAIPCVPGFGIAPALFRASYAEEGDTDILEESVRSLRIGKKA